MARIVADKMSKTLGQQIVIENRGGAGGTIATRAVAKSAPDGYTLVIGGTGTLAINPTLYPNAGYDPRKDFAPVGLIATSALVVLVHPSVPAHSIEELIALAKKEPGKLNYASAGPGSGIHLGTELFASMAGIRFTHIPYRGTAPALNDLLGGHVDIYFSSLPPALGLDRRGQGAGAGGHGIAARAGAPRPADGGGGGAARLRGRAALRHRRARRHAAAIVDKLNAALREALAAADTRAAWPAPASSRCPARPRTTPPTSTARRPNGRASSSNRARRPTELRSRREQYALLLWRAVHRLQGALRYGGSCSRRCEELDQGAGRIRLLGADGDAGREHRHPLDLRRQRPDEIDARHGQQLADLLEADLGLAARHHGGHPLAFDPLGSCP